MSGRVEYLFNYCAHNGCFDRRFDWNDAVDQWRNGNGATVTDVKASELNLSGDAYAKNPDGSYQIHTSIKFDTGAIYGTVTGVLNADGTMSIRPDTYDFDQKNPFKASTLKEFGRFGARLPNGRRCWHQWFWDAVSDRVHWLDPGAQGATKVKVIAIGSVILLGLLIAGYLFVRSDAALLGDEVCLKIASTDVLGNSLYGHSCPRSSYASDVENLHNPDKAGAAFFKFRPLAGRETQCPLIAIIVDRKTGEAWIAK